MTTTNNTMFNCRTSQAAYFRDALGEIAAKSNISIGQLVESIFENYIKQVGDAGDVLHKIEEQDFYDAIDHYEKNGSSSESVLAKLFFVIDSKKALVGAFPNRFAQMVEGYERVLYQRARNQILAAAPKTSENGEFLVCVNHEGSNGVERIQFKDVDFSPLIEEVLNTCATVTEKMVTDFLEESFAPSEVLFAPLDMYQYCSVQNSDWFYPFEERSLSFEEYAQWCNAHPGAPFKDTLAAFEKLQTAGAFDYWFDGHHGLTKAQQQYFRNDFIAKTKLTKKWVN